MRQTLGFEIATGAQVVGTLDARLWIYRNLGFHEEFQFGGKFILESTRIALEEPRIAGNAVELAPNWTSWPMDVVDVDGLASSVFQRSALRAFHHRVISVAISCTCRNNGCRRRPS